MLGAEWNLWSRVKLWFTFRESAAAVRRGRERAFLGFLLWLCSLLHFQITYVGVWSLWTLLIGPTCERYHEVGLCVQTLLSILGSMDKFGDSMLLFRGKGIISLWLWATLVIFASTTLSRKLLYSLMNLFIGWFWNLLCTIIGFFQLKFTNFELD